VTSYCCLSVFAGALTVAQELPREKPLVEDYTRAMVGEVPTTLTLDGFYRKYVDALGIPVVSSGKPPDIALLMARDIVIHMLAKRPELREALIAKNWRIGVMAQTEMTTDIPEHRDRKKPPPGDPRLTVAEKRQYESGTGIAAMSDKEYWDRRARGLGGNPTTCAEENLLGYPGTRYYGEHILVHEFAHAIMGGAIRDKDPALFQAIQDAYRAAMKAGKYKGHYAATNANEYWAEGTQWWFWSNYGETFDGQRVQSPADLKAYDPTLYGLLGQVYHDHRIPADIYHGRNIPPRRPGGGASRSVQEPPAPPIVPPIITVPDGSAAVEQRAQGTRAPAVLVDSFDGLGVGFEGPQGSATLRNPSDNTLAVGPDHIVQIVNTRMAIFTKKGKRFDVNGRVLYGPVPTNNLFRGFGGQCEARNNGDAVVRYDQLAERWLIVMPIFGRDAERPDQPSMWTPRKSAYVSPPGRPGQPGPAVLLYQPPSLLAPADPIRRAPAQKGPFSMCYAISTGTDPLGRYYRYEFLRPLFPDYPRPAVWPDGYYVPTSTGDDVIEKHACVVARERMLKGEPATEQCFVIAGVNFLNNADVDGSRPPPRGAPNIMLAAGGTQLKTVLQDDRIFVWQIHVDWKKPERTKLVGPEVIAVAPYRYLCDGQLTHCVPQPGTDRRLDAQGDKIMARVVYRRLPDGEALVAVHSVNTGAGGGGVRWYEFRVDRARRVLLSQHGTYAPDRFFRWMASPAMDREGNIGIGYSFGGSPHFAGQRFAARLAGDPPGLLTLAEAVLVEGEDAQNAMRWQDYTQTAMDPTDDCTMWYVGDYIGKGAPSYSTRIGAFRLPGCS
jgi:hypothetical protein